jgi:hypothetical protein
MAMFDERRLTTAIERSLSTYLQLGRRASVDSGRLVAALEDHLRLLMADGLDDPQQLHVAGVRHLADLHKRLSPPSGPQPPGRRGRPPRKTRL